MKLISNILIIIVLSITSLCEAQCGSPTNQTVNMFDDFQGGIDLVNNCDFPTQKFNASCVSASCPQLASSGLCPYTSNRNLNLTALTSILTILNTCFKQRTTICDTPLANIPIPPVGIGLDGVFGILPVGGQCSKIPSIGFINNVQDVSFAISPAQSSSSSPGPLNVVINAPAITIAADIQCSISVFNQLLNFNLPNINCSIAISISPTASIDFSNEQPDVQARADNFTFSFQVGNFAPISSSIEMPGDLSSLFTSGISSLWESSGNPMAIANFYSTFIAYGIEATKGNCPSP